MNAYKKWLRISFFGHNFLQTVFLFSLWMDSENTRAQIFVFEIIPFALQRICAIRLKIIATGERRGFRIEIEIAILLYREIYFNQSNIPLTMFDISQLLNNISYEREFQLIVSEDCVNYANYWLFIWSSYNGFGVPNTQRNKHRALRINGRRYKFRC